MAISPRTISLLQAALMRGGEAAVPEVAAEASQVARPAFGSLAPGVQQAVEAAPAAQGIRAYHGSPHDFDQFDLSKIGTGEGAQAYGHGLYLAETEGVAKQYRDALAGQAANPARNQQLADLAREMSKYETPGKYRQYSDPRGHEAAKEYDRIMEERAADKGHMYETRINADPEHFLDWDKPLSEQSQHVRDTLKSMGIAGEAGTGADLYHGRSGFEGGMPEMSKAMREAGIPGIRYLDQGSRVAVDFHTMKEGDKFFAVNSDKAKQSGPFTSREDAWGWINSEKAKRQTRNYVVFNDKLIEIMRKYGLAGLIGGGGLAKLGGRDDN